MAHEHHEHHEHEGQACQCGHHHDEQHEQHEKSVLCNQEEITVTHHEGAVILSTERVIAKEYSWVRDRLNKELQSLAGWVEDQGGLVGHIKAFLTETGYTCMLSTTGEDVQIKETLKPKVTAKITLIVFINNENELYSKLAETLKKLVN
ncbi:hypothetical protein [Dehalobacter sp. TBBPA1]|uniref:hypothetical protein n=1 Tax=Dehalobacter sp. TBBPA1 TaxID=3235037 RepID=UPI0034A27D7A